MCVLNMRIWDFHSKNGWRLVCDNTIFQKEAWLLLEQDDLPLKSPIAGGDLVPGATPCARQEETTLNGAVNHRRIPTCLGGKETMGNSLCVVLEVS